MIKEINRIDFTNYLSVELLKMGELGLLLYKRNNVRNELSFFVFDLF
ncbi:MAG: hypothetical protein JNJ86_16945 [Chitinophagaceae bacterium]|nr:hypothetical protein [Chitinophagaceae bacterium]